MKTEFFPKPTDECAKKYSCTKIRFSFENPNNPFLEITFADDKSRFLLWNTIIDKYQFFNVATGEVETQFDISKTRDNKIILRGNVYNALDVLHKIGLISKEMFDEIYFDDIYDGVEADELKAALDGNKHFKLLSQIDQVQRTAVARKPTEILSDSDSAKMRTGDVSKQPEVKEDSSEKKPLKLRTLKRCAAQISSDVPIARTPKLEDDEEHSAKARRTEEPLKFEAQSLSSSSISSSMASISSSSSSSFFLDRRISAVAEAKTTGKAQAQKIDPNSLPGYDGDDTQMKDARTAATPPLSQH